MELCFSKLMLQCCRCGFMAALVVLFVGTVVGVVVTIDCCVLATLVVLLVGTFVGVVVLSIVVVCMVRIRSKCFVVFRC